MDQPSSTAVPVLTRAKVARRLKTSIASIRRLERRGVFQPQRDARGVNLFDPAEVEAVAEARGLADGNERGAGGGQLEARVLPLEQRLAALEAGHLEMRQAFDALKATNDTLGTLALTLLRARG